MTLMDDLRRPALIAGLRDLADFLEANPGAPVPYMVDATAHVQRDTDEAMCGAVDRAASLTGAEIDAASKGRYRAVKMFGPVAYRVVAVLADARNRLDAMLSYWGSVIPDDDSGESDR